jgi:hypothetical protein
MIIAAPIFKLHVMSEVTELVNCTNADMSAESIFRQLLKVDIEGNIYLNIEVHTEVVDDYASCSNQEITSENLLRLTVSNEPALKVVLP